MISPPARALACPSLRIRALPPPTHPPRLFALVFRLDYPGVGPEHAFFKEIGRAEYHGVTDDEALAAFQLVSRMEGIIPALETSHALAYLDKLCPELADGTRVVLNCSGRGDKDVQTAAKFLPSMLG